MDSKAQATLNIPSTINLLSYASPISRPDPTIVWFCCDCGYGPHLWASHNTHCAQCAHLRCNNCKVQSVSASVSPQSFFGSPGATSVDTRTAVVARTTDI